MKRLFMEKANIKIIARLKIVHSKRSSLKLIYFSFMLTINISVEIHKVSIINRPLILSSDILAEREVVEIRGKNK